MQMFYGFSLFIEPFFTYDVSILHTLTIKADFHKPANTYKEDNTLLYIN